MPDSDPILSAVKQTFSGQFFPNSGLDRLQRVITSARFAKLLAQSLRTTWPEGLCQVQIFSG